MQEVIGSEPIRSTNSTPGRVIDGVREPAVWPPLERGAHGKVTRGTFTVNVVFMVRTSGCDPEQAGSIPVSHPKINLDIFIEIE